jgi:ubiquinone/menaquinone biosynthesis C-methylase UbiE
MGLAQLLVGHHHRDDRSGGLITHPRSYELFTEAGFLGRRTRVFDRLVALSGAKPGQRVLDVGCGTGFFARRIAQAVGPKGAVVGVDPSQPMLDYAEQHAPDNCSFVNAGAEDLPFDDASFDVVVSSLAFHHFPVDRRADGVNEIFRVVRPGGRLFVADFSPPSGRVVNWIVGVIAANAMRHDHSQELRELVVGSGLTITGTGRIGFLHYIAAQRPQAGKEY